MDDRSFLESIAETKPPKKEGEEFLQQLKVAGVKEYAVMGLEKVLKNKIPLAGAAIGATTATALQYLANRPKKDGSPSTQRRMAEGGLASSEKSLEGIKAKGKEPGFVDELQHSRAKSTADLSKVLEKHPARGALLATPVGAAAGAGLAALAKNFMKQANGDMLQYFKDNPEKLKEKQERDAKKKEKKASKSDLAHLGVLGAATAGSGLLGHRAGLKKGRREAGEVLENAQKYGTEPKNWPTKKASSELLEVVDSWGRELAKTSLTKEAVSFNKVNEVSKMLGRASRLWEKHGPAVKQFAGSAGKKLHEGVKAVGSKIGDIKDPIAKGTAIGAATGGIGGAVQGFLDPKENPYTGEKQRLRTAFRKGLAGTAGGAATGALFGSMGKTSSVQVLEKAAAGVIPSLGGVAKNFVSSMGATANKALTAATPHIQTGMKALGNASMGQSAGVGAAGGAALGAAKGLVAPGKDANGQQRSRLGGMARGAVGGGVLGAGLGAGAKAALPHAQPHINKRLGLG